MVGVEGAEVAFIDIMLVVPGCARAVTGVRGAEGLYIAEGVTTDKGLLVHRGNGRYSYGNFSS